MNKTPLLALAAAIVLLAPEIGSTQDSDSLGIDNQAVIGQPLGSPVAGAELDQRTEELTSVMRCPVCQGLSIADSGTMIAMAMKEEVRQFIAAGYTDDQILLYFEASYGEFIRLEPKPKGFNLMVWVAPIAVLLMGALLVVYRLRSKPTVGQISKEHDELDEYRERVRREISS